MGPRCPQQRCHPECVVGRLEKDQPMLSPVLRAVSRRGWHQYVGEAANDAHNRPKSIVCQFICGTSLIRQSRCCRKLPSFKSQSP
jgi:hypothetical protein